MTLRSLGGRGIQFIGTIALARMLSTSDFGILAFGLTILALSGFAADLGLGASLVRRHQPVETRDLEVLLFLQLTLGAVIVGAAFSIGPLFGRVGLLTAVMVAGLPLLAVRAPASVLMERSLDFRWIAVAEVSDVASFYLVAIAGVALGGGVWAVACAGALRPLVGTALIQLRCPVERLRPRVDIPRIKSLLHFGARYQAAAFLNLARDQGLNIAVIAVAGASVLGFWSLAYRILQVPFLLFSSLWRVSFPAMARIIQAGGDARGLVAHFAEGVALATGMMLVPLLAGGPVLVTGLMGRQWRESALILLPGAVGLLYSGPISVSSVGVLYALGDSMTALWAIGTEAVLWWTSALLLLRWIGAIGIGVGWLLAASAEAAIFARAVHRRTGTSLLRALGVIPCFGAAAGVGGWFLARSVATTLPQALCAAAVGEAVFIVAIFVARPVTARRVLLSFGMGRRKVLAAAGSRP